MAPHVGTFHKIVKRERAFDLAHLEADFEQQEQRERNKRKKSLETSKENAADTDEACKDKCNDDLRRGLDMVKVTNQNSVVGQVLCCRLSLRFSYF